MNKRVPKLAVLLLAVTVLSGCSELLPWDNNQSHNITTTPHLATAGSPLRDEPSSQTPFLQQHKENSEKHSKKAAYPDIEQHMNYTKGNHHDLTNQQSGRKEVISISLHKDEPLISRDNLNFLVLGSIAILLTITAALQWIFRCKGA
tara:strand:+ start:66 stop:506 length:441 start_codon:yes stop_codon:yes gene_type:complete